MPSTRTPLARHGRRYLWNFFVACLCSVMAWTMSLPTSAWAAPQPAQRPNSHRITWVSQPMNNAGTLTNPQLAEARNLIGRLQPNDVPSLLGNQGTIMSLGRTRIDMQGTTGDGTHNIQVQRDQNTVAGVLIPGDFADIGNNIQEPNSSSYHRTRQLLNAVRGALYASLLTLGDSPQMNRLQGSFAHNFGRKLQWSDLPEEDVFSLSDEPIYAGFLTDQEDAEQHCPKVVEQIGQKWNREWRSIDQVSECDPVPSVAYFPGSLTGNPEAQRVCKKLAETNADRFSYWTGLWGSKQDSTNSWCMMAV